MDFTFTPEQEALREQAREFLAATPEPTWAQLAELGWTRVSIPEEDGAGLTFVEEAVLFEELGRARSTTALLLDLRRRAARAPGRPAAEVASGEATLDARPRAARHRPRHGRPRRDRRR